ncbi:MAG: Gfo/Idh/MocA family oxidoreductase [Chloroflexi bacterium]|nr:Gfo/Idh/MocA family oxidoreductase [Chloroflexota bacterium]
MRFALIGNTGHVNYYEPVLRDVPELEVVAVCLSAPDERMDRFDAAPGVTPAARRYTSYQEMLDREAPDLVQVCAPTNLIPPLIEVCLRRGIAVMAEKPLARDLPTLDRLYALAKQTRTPLAPLYGYRRMDCFAVVKETVANGSIGEPLLASSQISYKWGRSRGDVFRTRQTFPGIVPFIGIHTIDWLMWMMGDVFVAAGGWESCAAHPDFPACASQAGYLLQMRNGGVAAVTLDFLRPESAPTHGDERVRIAGSRGVIESTAIDGSVTVIDESGGPRSLAVPHVQNWYTDFVRSVQDKGDSFITLDRAFRVTEIAIKVQEAIDRGATVSLTDSSFRG